MQVGDYVIYNEDIWHVYQVGKTLGLERCFDGKSCELVEPRLCRKVTVKKFPKIQFEHLLEGN